jgi:hypothetical protein
MTVRAGDVVRFDSMAPEEEPLGTIVSICTASGCADVMWDDGEIYTHDDCDLEVVCAA